MNPQRLMTLPCTITHVVQTGAADVYGDPTETTTTTTSKCWIEQTRRSDDTQLTNQQTERWAGYFRPDVEIDGSDRVMVDAATYQVMGPPWRALHPRLKRVTHIEATLERVV